MSIKSFQVLIAYHTVGKTRLWPSLTKPTLAKMIKKGYKICQSQTFLSRRALCTLQNKTKQKVLEIKGSHQSSPQSIICNARWKETKSITVSQTRHKNVEQMKFVCHFDHHQASLIRRERSSIAFPPVFLAFHSVVMEVDKVLDPLSWNKPHNRSIDEQPTYHTVPHFHFLFQRQCSLLIFFVLSANSQKHFFKGCHRNGITNW